MKKISGNPFLKKENGKIFIDLVPFEALIKKYKTPILILLENRIRENINTFRNVFTTEFKHFKCFYSLKANFLPEICKIIYSEGIGVELIGLPELKLALRIGFPPRKIIIGGPYLSKELIEASIKNKVREIIIYDLNDLKIINSIAQKFDLVQKVCIRINSQKFKSKLGVELNEQKIKQLKESLISYPNIKLTSILSHYGTQMNDLNQYKRNFTNMSKNLKVLQSHNITIENINFGGGFPEATIMSQDQLKKIAKSIKFLLDESEISYRSIYFEPGRYFIGDSGLFIAKIIKVGEKRWIFLNIGNHICPKFAKCSLRFYNASLIEEPHKYKTSIAGIIPTDQDVLVKNYFFTEQLKQGNKILITNTGAYCLTFSNRFPYSLPKILLIKGNYVKEIFDPAIDQDFSIN
ncbi:MAG: diaminopimelate decarboxylase family protein [Promethearchaeota archaeon]